MPIGRALIMCFSDKCTQFQIINNARNNRKLGVDTFSSKSSRNLRKNIKFYYNIFLLNFFPADLTAAYN